ncbi:MULTISPECIES: CPBP family intramembrane glutamic endopeptidase [Siminovitchia]|uniref:CPBP family intramembrane glutamic endopeptidase n=1 Tax=Siminovitchia TaxID=2837510 RepID=UPI00196274E1
MGLLISDVETTFHPFLIATFEEFLFRYLILIILRKEFSKSWSFIIGSILFAMLLHLNGDWLLNIMIKFPSSLILYYLADKYGLQDAIAFHWLHNLAITVYSQ